MVRGMWGWLSAFGDCADVVSCVFLCVVVGCVVLPCLWLMAFSIGVWTGVLSCRKLVIRACGLLEWMLVFLCLGLRVLVVWMPLVCDCRGGLVLSGGGLGLGIVCSGFSSG